MGWSLPFWSALAAFLGFSTELLEGSTDPYGFEPVAPVGVSGFLFRVILMLLVVPVWASWVLLLRRIFLREDLGTSGRVRWVLAMVLVPIVAMPLFAAREARRERSNQ